MAKERISSNVSNELATQVRHTAKQAGLSVSAFIEKAVEGLLGRSCLLVENSRLSKDLDQRGDRINELCRLANTIGVEHKIEIDKSLDDEYLAKLCDAIHAKIEVLTESHDIFKAASEERAEQLEASEAKVKALLERGWWARLCNRVPRGIIKPTGE